MNLVRYFVCCRARSAIGLSVQRDSASRDRVRDNRLADVASDLNNQISEKRRQHLAIFGWHLEQ